MAGYSLSTYSKIIRTALSRGYRFAPFRHSLNDKQPTIFLRHDVDYSLTLALKMAQANEALGVRGTFFLLFRSEIYNVLSPASIALAKKIHELHQFLGMHAVARVHGDGSQALQQGVSRDFKSLRNSIPQIHAICSWHNPTPELIRQFREKRFVGGLLNTYASDFTQRVAYMSDSNRRHSVEDFLSALDPEKHPFLQFLFHPLYWVCPEATLEGVFAQTWSCVVREREAGFLENSHYLRWFPHGMPNQVLKAFSTQWKRSVRQTHKRK
jgi:hypothetical protein